MKKLVFGMLVLTVLLFGGSLSSLSIPSDNIRINSEPVELSIPSDNIRINSNTSTY
ncbi:hypothetical protein N0O92_10240 [Alkalihalobacillus sp. MEB130]|uniref:hypothetical protein n=1 Tax=Alkalihalobacillus sp. MEB130 TaxID=2976704 RepID=UPI0028E09DDE|nr:hypothetical protein [Alkalihalobacillus sp. MEB130]MDT8860613.1 hypothetical protein [Alkalihalobacillus sp. MEB130]